MEREKAIVILEALASGYSPTTGEQISNDSVLNERDVIRALQFFIDHFKDDVSTVSREIHVPEVEINQAVSLFSEQGKSVTPNRLAAFFMGTRQFRNDRLLLHPLYGKYLGKYSLGHMMEFLTRVLPQSSTTSASSIPPYREIDYFRREKFNRLTEPAVEQLKNKIKDLGLIKTENLTPAVLDKRKQYPRAYEPWSDIEKDLLKKAIQYTNDLDLLAACFQRAPGSIESVGQKIIFEETKGV